MDCLISFLDSKIAEKNDQSNALKVIKKLCLRNKLTDPKVPITVPTYIRLGETTIITETPMYYAVNACNVKLIELLINAGVEPKNDDISITYHSSEVFEFFLTRGIPLPQLQNLFVAFACNTMNSEKEEETFKCIKRMADYGVNFQGKNYDVVADICKGFLTKYQIADRIDFLKTHRSRWSVSHEVDMTTAVFHCTSYKLIKYFLREGANVNHLDYNGAPLLLAFLDRYNYSHDTDFTIDRAEAIKIIRLLSSYGACTNSPEVSELDIHHLINQN